MVAGFVPRCEFHSGGRLGLGNVQLACLSSTAGYMESTARGDERSMGNLRPEIIHPTALDPPISQESWLREAWAWWLFSHSSTSSLDHGSQYQ
jgi:hypothetical protein